MSLERRVVQVAASLCLWLCLDAASAATQLVFALPRAATTSAGIYDAGGHLIRTLWRGEALPPGEYRRTWDDRDDRGQLVAAGTYEARLVQHQLGYVWEGVIGNSSSAIGEPLVHKAYLPPTSIAISGNQAFYAVGYNERQPGLQGFQLATPQINTRPLPSIDPFVSYSIIALDATRLYWANTGGLVATSFTGAFDLVSSRPATFTSGRPVCLQLQPNSVRCYEPQSYASVIDLQSDPAEQPTGLAVQRAGRVLAVAHGGRNRVRLFDKSSGKLLREIALPLASGVLNQIAMSANGDLWIISGTSVLRYTSLDSQPKQKAAIGGLVHPLALAASPSDDGLLWVADGGASQQLKRFDAQGNLVEAIGQAGGYAIDPTVRDDKLCFRTPDGREQTGLALSADGELWVIDRCNNRMLRFGTGSAAARGNTQIAYLPAFYASTVDHADPRRVFANFLEFDVDTTAPLAGERSWRLVRNWLAGLPPQLADKSAFNGLFGGFLSVETLSNGRTYGVLRLQNRQAIVELPVSGPLRLVTLLAAPAAGTTGKVLYENGELGYAITGPTSQTVLRQPLTGFDENGNPLWSNNPVVLASVPTLAGSPYYHGAFSGMPPRFPVTASGKLVFFDQAVVGNEGFHLGAAELGASQWLWQASPSGVLDGKGAFQTKAVDGSVHYGGNAVWTSGRHIFYGYHGEFYKDMQNGVVGQANQVMHFDENGLFLGQFGQSSTRPSPPFQPGLSGNAFSPTLVHTGEQLYLYHNDESSHGGVHRWRIDGWNDVQMLRGVAPLGGTIPLR